MVPFGAQKIKERETAHILLLLVWSSPLGTTQALLPPRPQDRLSESTKL